ncbi:hypothetical protein [Vibrio sonorensis]|uniref:hypothetical protein n=1 Tax=Vibrio sonorensis TaxID=1004316 RepID=UPI0008DA215B|nr:hypothetical protein [Vibrio sonorensis]
MGSLKLALSSVVVVLYSNLALATDCQSASAQVLEYLAKTSNVTVDAIAVDKTFYQQEFSVDVLSIFNVVVELEEAHAIKLRDEDVVDPIVYFDEEELEPKLRSDATVKDFQALVYKACSKFNS